MKVALALTVCCLSASALAQELPKVPVQKPFQVMTITSAPVMLNDRTILDVSSFALGLSGDETMAKANALKTQGYEYNTIAHVLECRGQDDYRRKPSLCTTARTSEENKPVQRQDRGSDGLALSEWPGLRDRPCHLFSRGSRRADGGQPAKRSSKTNYGEANSVTKDNNGFPDVLRWQFRNAVLEVRITAASTRPSLVGSYRTTLTRTLRGQPVDYAAKDQSSLCAETQPIDEANIRKLNERQQTGPKL